MDEYEVTCIITDDSGSITHVDIKEYGIQTVATITWLIEEISCSFYAYKNGHRTKIFVSNLANGSPFLTTDPIGVKSKSLDFLPQCKLPLLNQLIEPSR